MSLLFLSFHLWCTALCDKHFIFTSWWCVQDHVSVMFTFSAALTLLNLCWYMLCISRSYSSREVSGHKLVRVVCNAVWSFLRGFFTFMRLLLKQIQRSLWNHSETRLMWWTGYRTPLCLKNSHHRNSDPVWSADTSTSAETGPVFSASADRPELSESQTHQTIIRFNSFSLQV